MGLRWTGRAGPLSVFLGRKSQGTSLRVGRVTLTRATWGKTLRVRLWGGFSWIWRW